jgi:hypothetical protein
MSEPALTLEEWSERVFAEDAIAEGEEGLSVVVDCQGEHPGIFTVTPLKLLTKGEYAGSHGVGMGRRQRIDIQRRLAVAALALYGLSEGFTRDDVEALRDLSEAYESRPGHGPLGISARSIADRIEALLPPKVFAECPECYRKGLHYDGCSLAPNCDSDGSPQGEDAKRLNREATTARAEGIAQSVSGSTEGESE